MKKLSLYLLFALSFWGCLPCRAQIGYRFGNEFISLTESNKSKYYVQFDSKSKQEQFVKLFGDTNNIHIQKMSIIPFCDGMIVTTEEKPDSSLCYVSNLYKDQNGNEMFIMPRIVLKLRKGCEIRKITQHYNNVISSVIYLYGIYRIQFNLRTSVEALMLANEIDNLEEVEWCEPVKASNIVFNDNLFSQQYYLKNTGQNGGTAGIDINVENAWNITKGNSNIIVAVIDDGVDLNHEDLVGNLVQGYTIDYPLGYGAPRSANDYNPKAHGTACAGIIAAKNNGMGVLGIASDIKVLPVNIAPDYANGQNDGGMATDDKIADAIRWAYSRADILCCSWSYSNSYHIRCAIDEARTLGRGGKGCVVVSSSGNDGSYVLFPANISGVIAVGAIDKNGSIWSYSSRGGALDLVAPSGNINQQGDVVTTDRMEGYGYNVSGNYTDCFGGTSAACPQVVGVAALMLSVRPDLTEAEVRTALQQTARDLGATGFDTTYGYGLVDAYAAVSSVAPYIAGNNFIYDQGVYSIGHLGEGIVTSWSLSGPNSSCFTLEEDVPSASQCRITRIDGAEFTGSAGLTLTAQVVYNGTVIDSLTKHLTAPYIDGPTVPCDHAVYSVVSRPENSTVAWETNGHGLGYDLDPNGLLPEDTTAHVIIPSDGEDIWGKLTANVIVDGDTVGVLSKYIDSGYLSGMWYQVAPLLDTTTVVPQPFSNRSWMEVETGRRVYLMSDDFIGATVTYTSSGMYPFNLTNSGGTLSFTPRLSVGKRFGFMTLRGTYAGSCRHFWLMFSLPMDGLEPILLSATPSGGAWQFALSEREGAERSDESQTALLTNWQLTVIKSDTGRTVYDEQVSGTSATVSTVGWLPGVYVAVALVDGQYISSKFVVSK